MKLLNHHTWHQVGWKHWVCEKCGAERYFDTVRERMVFTKHGKEYYTTPDCNSTINCDTVIKNSYLYTNNQGIN